jgi:hypothetical protein
MHRPGVVVLALGLVLLASICLAQAPGQLQTEAAETSAPPAPAVTDREATGDAVVELADFVCGVLEDSGLVPDYAQVTAADGSLRRLSAAEVFALFARTAYLWDTTGELPALVPIAPEGVAAPQLEAEDVPQGAFDPESGREVPTDQFLNQCSGTLRWIDRLKAIPTAVWVNGERLSAADYLAGLAICIQYAYWQETLEDTIFLPDYIPPQTWLRGVSGSAVSGGTTGESSSEGTEETQEGTEYTGEAAGGEEAVPEEVAPLGVVEEGASESPMLTLLPEDGARVSGKVDLLAVYTGPPAGFVIFAIDGATRAIQNYEPYSYRWDATEAKPGPHMVRVRIFDEAAGLLIDGVSQLTVVPRPAEKPGGGQAAPVPAASAAKAVPAPSKGASTKSSRKR